MILLEYDNQFFEIHTVDVPTNLYSYPSTKVNVTVRCMSVRSGCFQWVDIDRCESRNRTRQRESFLGEQ